MIGCCVQRIANESCNAIHTTNLSPLFGMSSVALGTPAAGAVSGALSGGSTSAVSPGGAESGASASAVVAARIGRGLGTCSCGYFLEPLLVIIVSAVLHAQLALPPSFHPCYQMNCWLNGSGAARTSSERVQVPQSMHVDAAIALPTDVSHRWPTLRRCTDRVVAHKVGEGVQKRMESRPI